MKGLRKALIAKAESLPFEDDSFDVPLIIHVFHLLTERASVINEAMRVSRKAVMSLISDLLGTTNPMDIAGDVNTLFKKEEGNRKDIQDHEQVSEIEHNSVEAG